MSRDRIITLLDTTSEVKTFVLRDISTVEEIISYLNENFPAIKYKSNYTWGVYSSLNLIYKKSLSGDIPYEYESLYIRVIRQY